jgi:hypothetical protein
MDTVGACPVPSCDGHRVANCSFCPEHQRLVNLMHLWLVGLPNDSGSTFDDDRLALGDGARRGV